MAELAKHIKITQTRAGCSFTINGQEFPHLLTIERTLNSCSAPAVARAGRWLTSTTRRCPPCGGPMPTEYGAAAREMLGDIVRALSALGGAVLSPPVPKLLTGRLPHWMIAARR